MSAKTQADPNRDEKGLFKKGNVPKVGFHTNPENKGRGFWKREDTPRFKLEQMMKLGDAELQDIIDTAQTPTFERKLAIAVQKGEWKEIKEMIDQVYGKPKETIEQNISGELKTGNNNEELAQGFAEYLKTRDKNI